MNRIRLTARLSAIQLVVLAACLLTPALVAAQTPSSTPPPPAQPRTAQFPKPVEKTLANGLRVIVIERAGAPLVSGQLFIKTGAEADPPELAGLSNMVADLMTKGTEKRSATDVAEAVEALAAHWNQLGAGIHLESA